MNRILITAAAALLACASQQKAPTATASTQAQEDRAAVIQPSSLSPEQVRLLQRSLIDRGFAVDLSGTYDEPTQKALTEFQRARGLPATGNLNGPTLDALGVDPRDVMPVRGSGDTSSQPPDTGSTSSGHSPSGSPPAMNPDSGTATPSTPSAPSSGPGSYIPY